MRQPHATLGQPADATKQLDRTAQSPQSPYAGSFGGAGAYREKGVDGGGQPAPAWRAADPRDTEEDLIFGVLAGGT